MLDEHLAFLTAQSCFALCLAALPSLLQLGSHPPARLPSVAASDSTAAVRPSARGRSARLKSLSPSSYGKLDAMASLTATAHFHPVVPPAYDAPSTHSSPPTELGAPTDEELQRTHNCHAGCVYCHYRAVDHDCLTSTTGLDWVHQTRTMPLGNGSCQPCSGTCCCAWLMHERRSGITDGRC
jgi:hypothetical protein